MSPAPGRSALTPPSRAALGQSLFHVRPPSTRHLLPVTQRHGRVPTTAGEIMTRDVIVLLEDSDVSYIARLMLDQQLKRVPIVSDSRVVGIVSRRDILRVLARPDPEIRAELQDLLDDKTLMVGRFETKVRDGEVILAGSPNEADRRLARLLARSVPGVVVVRFEDETERD